MTETPFIKKKSLGQNFLTSDIVPTWMCDAADIKPDEVVLEIGPGSGVLTKELLARGAKVIALEADQRAVSLLEETFAPEIKTGKLTVHHADARELDITKYSFTKQKFKVASNIPYYLTGWLFRTLLEHPTQPQSIVFLIQKEVAKRITTDPKSSLLSISVQVFGEAKYIKTVSRGHFSPPPKVDSAIIAVRNINQDNFNTFTPEQFFTILHLGFGQKRKQLLSNLSKQYPKTVLTAVFNTLNLDLKTRAEDLSPREWLDLVELLIKRGD